MHLKYPQNTRLVCEMHPRLGIYMAGCFLIVDLYLTAAALLRLANIFIVRGVLGTKEHDEENVHLF